MREGYKEERTACINRIRGVLAEVIAKFKTMQMVDVHVPTTDGRELVLSRYTQPEPDHRMLLDLLRLKLPEQPPPKISAKLVPERRHALPA